MFFVSRKNPITKKVYNNIINSVKLKQENEYYIYEF